MAVEPKKSTVRKATVSSAAKQADVLSDEDEDDEIGSIIVRERSKAAPTVNRTTSTTAKATSRINKTAKSNAQVDSDDDDELAQPEIPKKKVGRPRTRPVEKESSTTQTETVPKPRGRPRLNAAAKTTAKTDASTGTQRKTTSMRNATTVNKEVKVVHETTLSALSGVKSSFLKEPAKKKKVTFQDIIDSDDDLSAVTESAPAKKATATSTVQSGLKAKPVRKVVASSGRGRKPASTAKDSVQPLSPKKATQVAKSNLHSGSDNLDEDELSSTKVDDKSFIRSPARHSENTMLSSPVKKINFAAPGLVPRKLTSENTENNENIVPKSNRPVDFGDSSFMASPARRLPSSPFHFTMKESPRRTVLLGKDQVDLDSHPDPVASRTSPLKASPKKGPLFRLPAAQSPSSTPFKLSLLKSPAKRICSPFKLGLSPEKSRMAQLGEKKEDAVADTNATSGNRDDGSSGSMHDQRRQSVNKIGIEGDIGLDDPFVDAPVPMELGETSAAEDEEPSLEHEHVTSEDLPEPAEEGLEEGEEQTEIEMQEGNLDHQSLEEQEPTDQEAEIEETHQVTDDVPLEDNNEKENDIEELHISSPYIEHKAVEEQDDILDHQSLTGQGFVQREDEELPQLVPDEALNHDEGSADVAIEQDARSSPSVELQMQEDEPEDQLLTKEEVSQEEEQEQQEDGAAGELDHITEESMDVDDENGNVGIEDSMMSSPSREAAVLEMEDSHEYDNSEEREDMQIEKENEEPRQMTVELEEHQEDASPILEDTGISSSFSKLRMALLSSPESSAHPSSEVQESVEEIQDEPQPVQSSPAVSRVKSAAYEPRQEDDPESDTDPIVDTVLSQSNRTRRSQGFVQPQTPSAVRQSYNEELSIVQGEENCADLGFTPLAAQLSEWKASTPVVSQPMRPRRRGVFSLTGNSRSSLVSTRKSTEDHRYRLRKSSSTIRKSSLGLSMLNLETLEDEVTFQNEQEVPRASPLAETLDAPSPVRELDDTELPESIEINNTPCSIHVDSGADEAEALREQDITVHMPEERVTDQPLQPVREPSSEDTILQIHEDDEENRSENASCGNENVPGDPVSPNNPTEENKENDKNTLLSVPSTPVRPTPGHLRTVHTVSKVPLRAEGEVSPLKASRKRPRSLSGLAIRASPRIQAAMVKSQTSPAPSPPKHSLALRPSQPGDHDEADEAARFDEPITSSRSKRFSSSNDGLNDITAEQQVLKGAVVFVDVHTTEGEDASGIFIELLTQMGARCVKSWSWNPRSSMSPVDGSEPKESKVGITHVIYKDGGVRTLEKVRHAAGLVKCVGVSWVLE